MIIKKYYFIIFIAIIFTSCVSDKREGPIISDLTLYNLAKSSSSFSFYKNSLDTLVSDPSSPHSAFIRVRFNPRAASAMNDSLSSLIGSSFPDESMIVKEIYNAKGGPLHSYVIMYKMKGASNSASGWVWDEVGADGDVIYSSLANGGQCVGCHNSPGSVDLVRTFGLH